MLKKSIKYLLYSLIVFCLCISLSIIVPAQNYNYYDPFTSWSALGPGTLLLCFIIALIPIIIGILIGVWIYKDAKKRGEEGKIGVIFGVIVILLNIFMGFFGLGISIVIAIIWLLIRSPIGFSSNQADVRRRCPNCGRPIPFDANICPYCGRRF